MRGIVPLQPERVGADTRLRGDGSIGCGSGEAIARGASSEKAAVEAGVLPSIGVRWFRKGGGMPPLDLAPVWGRAPRPFTEREEIAVLLAGGSGVREIARRLGRAPSTISRELQRNAAIGRGRVEYRASTAQRHAERLAQRPKPAKLAVNVQLRAYVQVRLSGTVQRPDGSVAGPDIAWRGRRQGPRKDRRWGQCWSPEQISGRLRLDSLLSAFDFRHGGAVVGRHEGVGYERRSNSWNGVH